MLPYHCQGAAMAIEDACVSAAIAHRADDLDQKLLAYERLRVPRARGRPCSDRSRERTRENHSRPALDAAQRDMKFALR
jgi:2-polyprenyl-6-methoxyphenol hydroxylase-like FAD-dependent oxidoreductase